MRFNRLLPLVVCSVIFTQSAYAQEEETKLIIEQLVEQLADEVEEDYDYGELTERLNYYQQFPIDINETQGEELQELRFLSPLQIEAFLSYRKKAGRFISLYELQSIDGFDILTIEKLLPFVQLYPPKVMEELRVKDIFKEGHHDLMVRYGRTIQQSEGYRREESDGHSRYLGSPDRYFVRYRYREPKHFQIALNMKKDPGEQFFVGDKNSGFDFYSASMYLHDLGKVKNLVIGDYSLQFGQGLSLWSGLSFGKGSLLQNVARQGLGLRPYTSSNEILFLRGLAGTIVHKNWEITPFVSYRKLDATLLDSSGTFTGLGSSGYHRTVSEVRHKQAVSQTLFGVNLQYTTHQLQVGAGIHRTSFSKEWVSSQRLYDQFDFTGKTLTNASLYYHYTYKGLYLFGEGAHSFQSGFAMVNGFISSISHDISLVLLHRYYQKNYYAFYNQGFAESSVANNERGFYSGLMWSPTKRMTWVVYADYFKFPWLRFRADGPSRGYDLFSQFSYVPNKRVKVLFRYRFRKKQENSAVNNTVHLLENVKRHQFRLEAQYSWLEAIKFRSRFEMSRYKKGAESDETGLMVYQDVLYKPMGKIFSGNIRVAWFTTASYNSRIYAFENDVLYGYSFPAYSNKGLRTYINVRCRLNRKMDLWFRYATFIYARNEIGSGLDLISGKMRSDIRVQFRIQI